jgi:hypothetical protein
VASREEENVEPDPAMALAETFCGSRGHGQAVLACGPDAVEREPQSAD